MPSPFDPSFANDQPLVPGQTSGGGGGAVTFDPSFSNDEPFAPGTQTGGGTGGGSSVTVSGSGYTLAVSYASSTVTLTDPLAGATSYDYRLDTPQTVGTAEAPLLTGTAQVANSQVVLTFLDGNNNPIVLLPTYLLTLTPVQGGVAGASSAPISLSTGAEQSQGGSQAPPLPPPGSDVDPQFGPAVFGIGSGRTAVGYGGLSYLHVPMASCLSNVDGSDQSAAFVGLTPVTVTLSQTGDISGGASAPGAWGDDTGLPTPTRYVFAPCGSLADGGQGFPVAAGDYFVFVTAGGVTYPVGQVTLCG